MLLEEWEGKGRKGIILCSVWHGPWAMGHGGKPESLYVFVHVTFADCCRTLLALAVNLIHPRVTREGNLSAGITQIRLACRHVCRGGP